MTESTSPENHSSYRNAAVDDALNSAAVETDQAKRMALYAQIEDRVVRDYPAVPLYYSVRYTLVKPYVKNLKITSMGILNLKNVKLTGHP